MMEKIDRSVAPRINDLQAMQLPAVTRKHLPNGVELVILNHGQQPVNRLTVVWGAGNADLDNPATLRLLCQTVWRGLRGITVVKLPRYWSITGRGCAWKAGRIQLF